VAVAGVAAIVEDGFMMLTILRSRRAEDKTVCSG